MLLLLPLPFLTHAVARAGTMVIRPYGYAIWEAIQSSLDASFKAVRALYPCTRGACQARHSA